MEKQDLINYKEKLAKLSEEEKKKRDLHLRQLATGEVQGPPVGYSSIDKSWLKHYEPQNIIRDTEQLSIYDVMIKNNKNNNGIAIDYLGNKITYQQLLKMIDTVANAYKALGVKKGDIVTLSLANTPENCISIYALSKIGAIANLIDLRLKGDKLINAIKSTNSKYLLTTDLFFENLNEVKNQLDTKIVMCSPFDSMIKPLGNILKSLKSPKIPKDFPCIFWKDFYKLGLTNNYNNYENISVDEPVCIVHTSGTTGEPKSVVLTSKNFNAMVNEYKDNVVQIEKNDRILSEVPPFLAYSALMGLNLPLALGIRLEMIPDYDPTKFADNVYKYKTAHVVVGPADWSNILENEKVSKRDYSFLKTLGSGSDKIPTEKRHEIDKILAQAGAKRGVMEGYGMSEVGSAAVTNLPDFITDDSVGIPLTKMCVGIFDERQNELPYNTTGEICFSGETVMKEYLFNPEATEEITFIGPDGKRWLRSGDIGYMNEKGNLFLQGRIKRIIVRFDGIKVFPNDLEKVISKHPAVNECCVVGIPNEEKGCGAIPVATIVLNDEYLDDQEKYISEIKEICKEELGEKYQPQDFCIVNELPLTDVGKIDYRKIEREYKEMKTTNKHL